MVLVRGNFTRVSNLAENMYFSTVHFDLRSRREHFGTLYANTLEADADIVMEAAPDGLRFDR